MPKVLHNDLPFLIVIGLCWMVLAFTVIFLSINLKDLFSWVNSLLGLKRERKK